MLAKLCFLILSVGAIGLVVLSLRQQRMETYHEMAVTQRELASMDRKVQFFQSQVAQREVPGNVTRLAAGLGELRSIGVEDKIFRPGSKGQPETAVADGTPARRRAVEPNRAR